MLPHDNGPNYSTQFNVDVFEGVTPSITGVDLSPGADSFQCSAPYVIGGTLTTGNDGTYVGFQERGYFVPTVAGVYSVSVLADELTLLWVGPAAVSGFDYSNAVLGVAFGSQTFAGTGTFTISAAQVGTFVPIREMWFVSWSTGKTGVFLLGRLVPMLTRACLSIDKS